jgi:hypothetical protein
LGGPVRTSVAAAALDVGPDDEVDDGAVVGVLLLDDEVDDEVLDGMLLDVDDGAVDGVLLLDDDDELDDDVGAVVGVVVVELEVDVGAVVGVVVVELDVDVLVVGGVAQPVTQKTLCLTSAPWEPSALIVSLTWTPCCGCGSMPVTSRV